MKEAAKHLEAAERRVPLTAYCAECHKVVEIDVHQGRAWCSECLRNWRWSRR